MLKLDILCVRCPGLTHQQFLDYWRDQHGPFFLRQPIVQQTVRRYVQSRTIAQTPPGFAVAPFDGVAQLWFDDMAGFQTYLRSPNYQDVIRLDEIKFTDPARVQFLFSEETTIMG